MSIRPLCPELAKKAQEELNEDPKTIERDLQHIKDWLSKQPHLRARTDDQWLVSFLRGCKYSLERTKEKLDLYYSMRSLAPELFRVKPTDSILKELLDLGTCVILPKLATPDSPRVMIFRTGCYDPAKYNMVDIFSATSLMQKILIYEDDATIVSGFKTIMDLEGVTVPHLLQLSPSTMKKMIVFSQDAWPLRMKGGHYINTPTWFDNFYNMIRSFLNEKNKKRLHVHNKNYEALYEHIPKDILPSEYGGNGGSMKDISEYWKAKVQEYSSWLEDDSKYGTDESKRVGNPRSPETMFGVDGSFRQLEFD